MFVFMSLSGYASDFTVFGALHRPGSISLRESASSTAQILRDPINVGVFGVRFGHGGVWGGEHTFAYSPSFLDSESRAVLYNSNLLIQAPSPVVKPYVTAGLGGVFIQGEGWSDIGSKFAVNYGGGLKFRIAGSVGGRIDVRGYSLPSVQDQSLNIGEVSLGVVFGF